MNNIYKCSEQCPIVAGLPDQTRIEILGRHIIQMCGKMRSGLIGPLCGLPQGEDKDRMTREALAASRTSDLSTV